MSKFTSVRPMALLLFAGAMETRPALSPGGKWVMCIRSEGPLTKLMLLPTCTGEARSVSTEGTYYKRVDWFPDRQRILFTGNELDHLPRTFVRDLRIGKESLEFARFHLISRVC